MGFVTKAFGGGGQQQQLQAVAAQQQTQAQDVAALRQQQQVEADAVAKRSADTAAAETAMRKVRSAGGRRGLLAYTDNADPYMGGA